MRLVGHDASVAHHHAPLGVGGDVRLVGDEDHGVPLAVELVEELGSDAFVHGHAALNGADSRETLVVRVGNHAAPRIGDTIYVKPRAGAQHAFHATTGTRL